MLKFKNLIISESASIDRATGNLSVFNIYCNLSTLNFPVIMDRIVVTIIMDCDGDGSSDEVIELLIKQKEIPDRKQEIPFTLKDFGLNLIIRVNNFIIAGPGKIEFIVKSGNEEIANSFSVTKTGK